jgi:CheY-like chemotaxis protein
VAEDNEMVKALTRDMLDEPGYRVPVSKDPEHCVDLVKKHQGVVHQPLTDIVMPKLNGKALYEVLNDLQPNSTNYS